jgi:sugar-specific transcriptional regulator TrmB
MPIMKLSEAEVQKLQGIGLSDKAARIYIAAIELGESTILELAQKSKVSRTSIYHVIEELIEKGCMVEVRRTKKTLYIATNPEDLYVSAREKLREFESIVPFFQERMHSVHTRSKIMTYNGAIGFKQVWDKVFTSKKKEYLIITPSRQFLEFVKEKYIIDEIVKKKMKLGFKSKQLVIDSPYARSFVARDKTENRETRFLPADTDLSFTEIICEEFVAFFSSRSENMIFVVEHDMFAETRASLFKVLWGKCK